MARKTSSSDPRLSVQRRRVLKMRLLISRCLSNFHPEHQQSLKWRYFLCTVCLRVDCHNSHRHFQSSSLGQIMLPLTDPPTWQVLPTMSPNQLCCPQILNRRARPPAKQHSHVFPASRHPVSHLKRGRRGTREAFNLQICWQLLFFYFLSIICRFHFNLQICGELLFFHFLCIQFRYFHLIYRFADNFYFWEFPSSEITFLQGITQIGKFNSGFLLLNFSFINKFFPKMLLSERM